MLSENLQYLKEKLKDENDIKYRELMSEKGQIYVIFSSSLCDSKFISQYIIEPLLNEKNVESNVETIKREVLTANIVESVKSKEDALLHIISGDAVILFSFSDEIVSCEAKGFVKRSVTMPITEAGIKSSREGFVESFSDNIALIKRRIRDTSLKFESASLGNKSKTVVVIAYIDGLAPAKLITYIKNKINSIDAEFVLNSNYIQESLSCKGTLFETTGYSEKVDVVTSKISEGRVAIIVDGTPFVVTAPFFFLENFQVPDDYNYNIFFGNISRLLRISAFAISTLLPGFYIALVTYHFSLIPTEFVFRLSISRAGVPFPTVIELLLMMLFFNISREAGIRLPQPIGQSMSIVGALILGDATVGAGLASQTTLIIVAVSSICSFIIPKLYGVLWIWPVIIVCFASVLGLPGFYMSFCILICHLAGLNSCGYPFLFPFGTLRKYKFRDIMVRGYLDSISNDILDRNEKK